ncbi:MAG: uracil-DNA glycosylase [Candidatus Latescibacterota bacterium]|nr:MAG: uracil-DNA glycosylase [Candidatus Latescibacterota bacterium]
MRTLEEVARTARECRLCELAETRSQVVFGAGAERAELMLVGEAPGRREDATGIPFVGQAGMLLDKALALVGLRRDEIYIANVLKCRPPKNRDPLKEEIEACRPYLDEQIAIVGPRVLAPMGNFALCLFSPKRRSISEAHGKMFSYRGIAVIPIYHPAAILYNRTLEPDLIEDFREIVRFLRSGRKAEPEPDQLSLF